ncbi:transposase [Serinicoccus sp. CNJ-927]|uniref:transposase n=1 Tax=Serinicoccus sp. CNJ-927 TaxID=1904970 RepID=UPI000AA969A5|nr:transposase [Serinicoccus sp. CNJ-927]
MTTAGVCRSLKLLTPSQRAQLGIPETTAIGYKRVHSGWRAIVRVVARGVLVDHDHELDVDHDTGEVLACPTDCPYEQVTQDEVATLLIQASLPPEFDRPPAVAIDGTDVESFARAHKRQVDADGASFYSFDRDARWGHRTSTDRRPTEHFFGYEAHIATYAPRVGAAPVPQLAAGLALRPGIRDRTRACLTIIDHLPRFAEVLLDRGYTMAKASRLARPLRDRNITLTMDLHKSQRVVRPGPEPGTVWVDGTLFTSALPQTHRKLEPPEPGLTAGEKARRREAYDAREPYRFVAHAKRYKKHSTQRFRGPAVEGHPFKVRCPNTPASMRMPHTIPTTTCVPGEPCGCGKTITISDTVLERDRQHHPWQSTRWAMSYNRRSLVEGIIGANRFQRLNLNRGFFRMTGLVATGLLLAVTLVGHNLVRLHAWHTVRGLPEPWQVHLGEPVDDRPLDKATRTRGRRKRRGD